MPCFNIACMKYLNDGLCPLSFSAGADMTPVGARCLAMTVSTNHHIFQNKIIMLGEYKLL